VKLFAVILLVGLVASLSGGEAQAADKIWSAVVLSSNVDTPKETPGSLRSVSERLKRVLGYNQLEILGSSVKEIDEQVECWLVPTPHFSLKVKARRANAKAARGGYLLNLHLFHDKRQLLESEAMLAPDSPLFIRGPLHARGQLLIVLQVQP
jgi:hypothetical protein